MKRRARERAAKRERRDTLRRSAEETAAANKWQSYRIGWMAGACVRAMDPAFLEHENHELRDAYQLGYRDGGIARRAALEHATKLYGHVPQVLRLQGEG